MTRADGAGGTESGFRTGRSDRNRDAGAHRGQSTSRWELGCARLVVSLTAANAAAATVPTAYSTGDIPSSPSTGDIPSSPPIPLPRRELRANHHRDRPVVTVPRHSAPKSLHHSSSSLHHSGRPPVHPTLVQRTHTVHGQITVVNGRRGWGTNRSRMCWVDRPCRCRRCSTVVAVGVDAEPG